MTDYQKGFCDGYDLAVLNCKKPISSHAVLDEGWRDCETDPPDPEYSRTVLVFREHGEYEILVYRVVQFRDEKPKAQWQTDNGIRIFNGRAKWWDGKLPDQPAFV